MVETAAPVKTALICSNQPITCNLQQACLKVKTMTNETEKPKSRARRQASSKKKVLNPAASLIEALKFISVAQKKAGPTGVQFCQVRQNWAIASDGIVTAAFPVQEDLEACPHTLQLTAALSKVGEDLSITQLNENALAVSSGDFRALVPCVGFDEVPVPEADSPCADIDNRVKEALASVAGLATDGANSATYAAVLLQAGSAVATNGAALLEAWHGIDLPPGLLLPKSAVMAIVKSKLDLVRFGFSHSSATFFFENGAFIKTQLYGERYPNYQAVLHCDNLNPWPVPEDFFRAIEAIEAFSPEGNVYFQDGAIFSMLRKDDATTYKIEGLPDGMGFQIKNLNLVKKAFEKVHFEKQENKAYFFGGNVRGAIMGLDLKQPEPFDPDKDIPF